MTVFLICCISPSFHSLHLSCLKLQVPLTTFKVTSDSAPFCSAPCGQLLPSALTAFPNQSFLHYHCYAGHLKPLQGHQLARNGSNVNTRWITMFPTPHISAYSSFLSDHLETERLFLIIWGDPHVGNRKNQVGSKVKSILRLKP